MIQKKKSILMSLNGGLIYCWIEYFWRGWTHWSMLLLAIIMCFLLDQVNELLDWGTPIWLQALIGGGIITGMELGAGLILNVWLGLAVWDYTNFQWNLWGQICVPYSILWMFLAVCAFMLFDFLRWIFWKGDMPRYSW